MIADLSDSTGGKETCMTFAYLVTTKLLYKVSPSDHPSIGYSVRRSVHWLFCPSICNAHSSLAFRPSRSDV